jgi:hypothetical protein
MNIRAFLDIAPCSLVEFISDMEEERKQSALSRATAANRKVPETGDKVKNGEAKEKCV